MMKTALCFLFPALISGLVSFSRAPKQPSSLYLSALKLSDVSSQLNENDLRQLASNGYIVKPNFLSSTFVKNLRRDIDLLRAKNRFTAAKIGQDSTNTLNTKIRIAETCFVGESKLQDEPNEVRDELYQVLENLRSVLSANELLKRNNNSPAPMLDRTLSEFLYAYYPKGGFYRRHMDSVPNSASSLRAYSLLIYLNEYWSESDGGYLRMHFDSGREFLPSNEEAKYIDVKPKGGTLVLFDSYKIPHEVLDTSSERAVVVGWYNRPFSSAELLNIVPETDKLRALFLTVAAALVSTGVLILLNS